MSLLGSLGLTNKAVRLLKEYVGPFLLLIAFLYVGQKLAMLFKLKIPGNVIGMCVLCCVLLVKKSWTQYLNPIAKLLLENMGLFFIPPGVALIKYFGLLKENYFAIISVILLSTLMVLLEAGILTNKLIREK